MLILNMALTIIQLKYHLNIYVCVCVYDNKIIRKERKKNTKLN